MKINLSGDRVDWIKKNEIFIYIITLTSCLFTIYFSFIFLSKIWILLLLSGFVSFFYVWKVPLLKGKNLRDLPGVKIYLIAFVWVLICVVMPTILSQTTKLDEVTGLIALALFVFIVSITIPFDIRDIKLDDISKKTIPQLIGVKSSVYISIILLIFSQIILQSVLPFNIGIWVFTFIGSFVLYLSKNKQSELFFSGIIDGLFVLQIGLIFLFK